MRGEGTVEKMHRWSSAAQAGPVMGFTSSTSKAARHNKPLCSSGSPLLHAHLVHLLDGPQRAPHHAVALEAAAKPNLPGQA